MSTQQPPILVIDFEPLLHGDDRQQQAVVEQIYAACHSIGFLYLTHCAIQEQLLQQLFAQMRRYFQLPLSVKQQVAWTDAHSNQGYIGIARERLDPAQPGDFKEALNIASIKPIQKDWTIKKEKDYFFSN
jgi:isopenicillin N synthase-like dioxygenase